MSVVKSTGYQIVIGNSALKALCDFLIKNEYQQTFILCDDHTIQHCLPILIATCLPLKEAAIIEVKHGESAKSLEFCAHILQTFIEHKADKNCLVVNLGGGVISDLGGFNASIYKRGIDYINIPTSLLAMADASIGGKTGIDFGGIKNVVGTFSKPKSVFIFPGFLKTLSARHYKNGLAEVFKIALVADKSLWNELKVNVPKIDPVKLIINSVTLKNKIVEKDPHDRGVRKILNFGHTIGHALESLFLGSVAELLHGEAIVIGMIVESHLALQKKTISKSVFKEISSVLFSVFAPPQLPQFSKKSLFDLMANDKKNLGSKCRFSLPDKIGSCKYDVEITEAQIKKALIFYVSSNK